MEYGPLLPVANLALNMAVIALLLRWENRITRLETLATEIGDMVGHRGARRRGR